MRRQDDTTLCVAYLGLVGSRLCIHAVVDRSTCTFTTSDMFMSGNQLLELVGVIGGRLEMGGRERFKRGGYVSWFHPAQFDGEVGSQRE